MSYYGGRSARSWVAAVLATHGRTCHLCGRPGATTGDHVVPRSLGGEHTVENGRPAHLGCNSARGNLTMAQWWAGPGKRYRAAVLAPSRDW